MGGYINTGESCHPELSRRFEKHRHMARYEFALERLAESRPRKLLDVGSGREHGAAMLLHVAEFVVGLDADPESVKYASRRYTKPDLQFIHGDAHNLPFDDEAFDALVTFEVIEHVEFPEKMAGELARVLRSGGCLILTTPNCHFHGPLPTNPYAKPNLRYHIRHYYPEDVFELLKPLFTEVVLSGQFIDPRYVRLEQSTIARAILRVKRSLGIARSLLPRSFKAALSRRLFGVSEEDITPKDISFSAENIEKCSNIVAICTK